MKRIVLFGVLSFVYLTGTSPVKAQSTTSANDISLTGKSSYGTEGFFYQPSDNQYSETTKDQAPEIQRTRNTDKLKVSYNSSSVKVVPSSGSYQGGCTEDDYYVEISGATFGNGWDISSVTICGVEACHIIMQSANSAIVYPNAGAPGTGDIVITSESRGKTIIKNAYTYKVPVPEEQSKNLQFSIHQSTSVDLSWTRGNGESCVVFMKQTISGFTIPSDNTTYTAASVFGKGTQNGSTGWYCVYNGSGTAVCVSGITPGAKYMAQVFEYNGPAGLEMYLNTSSTENSKVQTPFLSNNQSSSEAKN